MADDWLAPALTGGGIGLASSVITFAIQQIADAAKRRGERAEKRQDSGRSQAKQVLADIHAVQASSITGKKPSSFGGSLNFNVDEVKRVRNDVALVTDATVREAVDDAFNCLQALGPAAHELDEPPYRVQRSLVRDAERIVAAYARGDAVPQDAVAEITSTRKIVDDAWDEALKNGSAWED